MPQYYFHIRDKDQLIADELGLALPNLKQAMAEARRGIADMLIDARLSGDDVSAQVMEIADRAGTVLATVSFRSIANSETNGTDASDSKE